MKTAEQKRKGTAERNETKVHHVIDFSTARTDKQNNVFKSTDDGDGLKGQNKNLRRNKMEKIMYVKTSRGFSGNHFGGNIHRVYRLKIEENEIKDYECVTHFWDTTQTIQNLPNDCKFLHQWQNVKYKFSNGKNISLGG